MVGLLLRWPCVCFLLVYLFVAILFLLVDRKSKMVATARQRCEIIHIGKNILKLFFSESKCGLNVNSIKLYKHLQNVFCVYRKSKMTTTTGKVFRGQFEKIDFFSYIQEIWSKPILDSPLQFFFFFFFFLWIWSAR